MTIKITRRSQKNVWFKDTATGDSYRIARSHIGEVFKNKKQFAIIDHCGRVFEKDGTDESGKTWYVEANDQTKQVVAELCDAILADKKVK